MSSENMQEMRKAQLLKLIGSLIKAADGDLVNKPSCFPCPAEQHEYYKVIRDCFQVIYTDADYTKSQAFIIEMMGKSDGFIKMKSKILLIPAKRKSHREKLLAKLSDLNQIDNALVDINVEHEPLFRKAIVKKWGQAF
ncbi:hypothetical protein K6Q96_07540 [Grimontia kaedaensis]|uniref:Uncharacterized protein n=1 Tax=Grimontia kaedaensis TaxID=2872157 RepID=A0ABY4WXX1_9GAMM|nr:hypothetical protein [Grimontia kaedaensis]USH03833.1 hypothetical protein K6Q96_07540 [Grimontia kaedaensis]